MGQIYKENHLLATKVLELEAQYEFEDDFLLTQFTKWVYFEKIRNREELKKSVKLYQNLKSEIDKTTKAVNLESIYSQKEFNDEKVKFKLLREIEEELKSKKF